MAIRRLGAVAFAGLSVVSAFQNTSPLFLFSTSEQLQNSFDDLQIASSSHIASQIETELRKCSQRNYVFISQPGVSTSDFADRHAAAHLRRWVVEKADGIKSSFIVPEVSGIVDTGSLADIVVKSCGGSITQVDANDAFVSIDGKAPRAIKVDFPALPSHQEEKLGRLAQHDSFLAALMHSMHDKDAMFIYTTSPSKHSQAASNHEQDLVYEMDDSSQSALRMDLRRDLGARAKNSTTNLPLFDRYQFFSPGIFMGLVIGLPLILVVYVGISALSSLEVSYFAFSKEMGPSNQKK